MMRPIVRRTYDEAEEQHAYDIGRERGTRGMTRLAHAGAEPVAYYAELRYPNAYAAGYWDGKAQPLTV